MLNTRTRSLMCCLALSCILLATVAFAQPGTVKAYQKISDTAGNFTGILDDDDRFGDVEAIGDLDDDGIEDLAVGVYDDDDGSINSGAVWILFMNRDGTVKAHQKISSTTGNFTGDLDADDQFGVDIASLGDFDGDGVEDIAVGSPNDDDGGVEHGAVWILFLNTNGTVKSHRKISSTSGNFTGPLAYGDLFGFTVISPGDWDGDGIRDLLVGADQNDDGGIDRGSVWVLFLNADGSVRAQQKISSTHGNFTGDLDDSDRFGVSLVAPGDIDGDGIEDLLVGADQDDDGGPDRGAIWVLFLNADGSVKSHQKISSTSGNFTGVLNDGDHFGLDAALLDDLDGDGVKDLAVGARHDDDSAPDSGAIWILFMNSDGTVKTQQKINEISGNFTGALDEYDIFGVSIAPLSDLDGDGIKDLAVGAQLDDDGGYNRGAVWVLFMNGTQPDLHLSKIVFGSTRAHAPHSELFTMNDNGSDLVQLLDDQPNDDEASRSPDGLKIAFRTYRDGDGEIYLIDEDGSNLTKVFDSPGWNGGTAYSPDGTRVAFTSMRDGDAEVLVVNIDGSNVVQLTDNTANDGFPSWSPDGTRIAFHSNRGGNFDIYVMDADGGNPVQLTDDPLYDMWCSWSPDGTRIAYLNGNGSSDRTIYVMDADGNNRTPLAYNLAPETTTTWSPDGTRIAFTPTWDGNREIYVMDADGGNPVRLTNHSAQDWYPSWYTPFHIGSADTGTSVSRILPIWNEGDAPLVVSQIISSDAQVTASPTNFTVPPGMIQDVTVTVTFTPTSSGTQYSTLTIHSNDPDAAVFEMIVNGIGQATPTVSLSIPDTVSTYAQPLSIPVRFSDATDKGVVSAELFLSYDGDLLIPQATPVSTTTATGGWTLEYNIEEGQGTSTDLLKIAMATDDELLPGAGDLVTLHFTVADRRTPAASPLVIEHALFNAGAPEAVTTDGSVTIVGVDGTITMIPEQIIPRQTLTVQVIDPDEDSDDQPGTDQVTVDVWNQTTDDSVSLILDEDAGTAGTFTGSVDTQFGTEALDDEIIQVQAGETVLCTYADALDGSGAGPNDRTDQTEVVGGTDGTVEISIASQPGDAVYIKVVDADISTPPLDYAPASTTIDVDVIDSRTADQLTVTLMETSAGGVFVGSVGTTSGSEAGKLTTVEGDTLGVIYVDDLTETGAPQVDRIDDNQVLDPWGDADDNDQLQAFDAALTLLEVIYPSTLSGLAELAANVDLDPVGTGINPYDASLILQHRVGIIDIFPVQDAASTNHPQPNPASPKSIPEERLLTLQIHDGYVSVWAEDRSSILAGDLLFEGMQSAVEMGEEMIDFLSASHQTDEGLQVVFAGAVDVSGPGELLRIYPGVDPDGVRLIRAHFNDGNMIARVEKTDRTSTPPAFVLHPNRPNPFNPETTIRYELPLASEVMLVIFDVSGQRVRRLVSGVIPAGMHEVMWNGRNDSGQPVSSGVYFYRLQVHGTSGGFEQMQRMLLLK